MTDEAKLPVPSKPGRFVKGQSGNPAGRKPGSRNAISLVKIQMEGEMRAQMKPQLQAIVQKIVDMALEGDRDMLKLIYKSWVSGTKASEDDTPKDKIHITIGKLENSSLLGVTPTRQPAAIGTTYIQE